MKKDVTVTVFSSDDSNSSSYETVVGPIGFLRIMWNFWRRNGTGFDDWARITAFVKREKKMKDTPTKTNEA